MEDFRCQCGKIVFQVDGDVIVIKCRHCKRLILIRTKGLPVTPESKKIEVEYR